MRTVVRTPLMGLLAAFALVAVGLGVPTLAAAAQTEVTIWTAFPEMHQLAQELAAKYMQENPNIKITATLFP